MRASFIVQDLFDQGLRLHGFGYKLTGLRWSSDHLASADSMAWSFHARRERNGMQNSLEFATQWAVDHELVPAAPSVGGWPDEVRSSEPAQCLLPLG